MNRVCHLTFCSNFQLVKNVGKGSPMNVTLPFNKQQTDLFVDTIVEPIGSFNQRRVRFRNCEDVKVILNAVFFN